MAINLKKNSTISLTKMEPQLTNVMVGLGWDTVKPKGFFSSLFGGETNIDLDASCILIDEQLNVVDTVWFRQLTSQCGSVKHQGDNRTGEGDGDDEKIEIALNSLAPNIRHLAFTVNSYMGQNFDKVNNAFCRIVNQNQDELCRFTLTEQGSHTGLFIGLLSREGNQWQFTSKGLPMTGKTVQELSHTVLNAL